MTALLTDRPRLVLEDALAAVLDADEHAHAAVLRLVNRARTAEEAEIITEMIAVRRALRQARNNIAAYHPQRLEDPEIMQIVEQRGCTPVDIRVDGNSLEPRSK